MTNHRGDALQRANVATQLGLGAGFTGYADAVDALGGFVLLDFAESEESGNEQVWSGRAHPSQPSCPHQRFKSCSAANSVTPSSRTVAGRDGQHLTGEVVASAILVRDHEFQLGPDADDTRQVLNVESRRGRRQPPAKVEPV